MIDLDRIDSELQPASRSRRRLPKPVGPAAPAIAPALAAASARVLARLRVPAAVPEPVDPPGPLFPPPRPRSRIVELVERGELVHADELMADVPSRRERVSWATMRAILDGREDTARAKNVAMHDLASESRDREAMDRYWLQRFWLVATWGTEDERQELAERCRDRAYRADDLEWTAALALLLAQMGKSDEAGEAFEDAFGRLGRAEERIQLDVATNLVEAAALLRDAFLASRLHYTLAWTSGRLVTVGEGWICKGAIERFRALGEAAAGMFAEADEDFRRAVVRHRAIDAQPLLAQTLYQWGTTLVGRDDVRAAECFREADALARDLELTDSRLLRRREPVSGGPTGRLAPAASRRASRA